MPIYDLTYRGWRGARTKIPAWFPILENTVRLAFRNRLLFWLYLACAIPPLIACAVLYVRYNFESSGLAQRGGRLSQQFSFDLPRYYVFLAFQGGLAIVVAGLVGSSAIAGDRRGNALETLFARSITRAHYLWGRFLGLFALVLGATLLPGFLIWVCDNLFSLDPERWVVTLSYPARIAAWAILLSASASLLILACSALIQRAWLSLAAFAVVVILGSIFTAAVAAAVERHAEEVGNLIQGCGYFQALQAVQRAIFGLSTRDVPNHASALSGAIVLALLAIASILVLRWRVRPIEVVS